MFPDGVGDWNTTLVFSESLVTSIASAASGSTSAIATRINAIVSNRINRILFLDSSGRLLSAIQEIIRTLDKMLARPAGERGFPSASPPC